MQHYPLFCLSNPIISQLACSDEQCAEFQQSQAINEKTMAPSADRVVANQVANRSTKCERAVTSSIKKTTEQTFRSN